MPAVAGRGLTPGRPKPPIGLVVLGERHTATNSLIGRRVDAGSTTLPNGEQNLAATAVEAIVRVMVACGRDEDDEGVRCCPTVSPTGGHRTRPITPLPEEAAMRIVPIHPDDVPSASSDRTADRVFASDEATRRTLGFTRPSRRTLGLKKPSRRTFGRGNPSRRTLGFHKPSRRTMGIRKPTRRTFGYRYPSRRTLGFSRP
jgi:hypothetical protein